MAINSLPVFAADSPVATNPYYPTRGDAEARRQFVERRHPEWVRNRLRWQFFLDSLEGGQRYREAIYGYDTRGLPVRNLIRHKHEYPLKNETPDPWTVPYASNYGNTLQTSPWDLPGQDQAAKATLDDYELRRARTPVPSFVREALETHLSKVYSKEVIRDGPGDLLEWWRDVDGKGTSIERWIEEEVAPQFLLIGFIDILFDHPPAPEGEEVRTEADVARLGLRSCRARTILPENMLWWRLDWRGRYVECLVGEYIEDDSGVPRPCFRHWTATESRLYDADGDPIGPAVPHRFGRVPIERFFDRRKARESNVGQSRYESICDKMREYYNRDSELVLADTQQVHAIVQGPEDVLDADGDMPVGPGWMLPMKKIDRGGTVAYEPWSILGYPTAGAASLRENKQDLRDGIDRDSRMVKPAGTAGTGANPVSQSGISKRMDSQEGNALLGQIAGSLQHLELGCATLALLVMREGREATPEDLKSIRVVYPKRFDLMGLNDLAAAGPAFQAFLAQSGESPEAEIAIACLFIRELLPGLEDERYAAIDAEIRATIEAKAEDLNRRRESLTVPMSSSEADELDEFDEPTSDVVEPSPEVDPLTLAVVQPLPQVSGGPLS